MFMLRRFVPIFVFRMIRHNGELCDVPAAFLSSILLFLL